MRGIKCIIKQRGRAFSSDDYILYIMHNYTLDIDHSYPLVLLYISL